MQLPSGNPFKCHEEVLYLQPMISPKRFDFFPHRLGGSQKGLDAFRFFFKQHICMYGQTYSKSMNQQGTVASPARGQLNSRETGSPVTPRVSPLILHTRAESSIWWSGGAFSRDLSRFPRRRPFIHTVNRHRASPYYIIVYQITQLHTDGVHCREAAGGGSAILKVVPVTCAAFSGFTVDHLLCASLFHTYPLQYWYVPGSG